MNIRELLKYELWTKGTTRKILWQFGIVLGSFAVGIGIWFAIEWYWLTPGERRAGKEALAQIDALQDLKPDAGDNFDLAAHGAEVAVETATKAAGTFKDQSICEGLVAISSSRE